MKYPEHYPTQTGFNPESPAYQSFRYAWEGPMTDESGKLAKTLKHSASAIEHEGGLCHIGYACHEAAWRLDETVSILKSDATRMEKMKALERIHFGQSHRDSPSLDVANTLRAARGEMPCGGCNGRGWNEVDTGDGRSDSNAYTEACELCGGRGVADNDDE